MTTLTLAGFGPARPSNGISSARVLFAAVNRWARIRRDRRVLGTMPDYLLADIGISRCDIDSATSVGRQSWY
jgi:uncharacterized protein YjiS (DUF1127 family)